MNAQRAVSDAARREVTLPTGRFLTAGWLACILAGGVFVAVAWMLGKPQAVAGGAAATGIVAAAVLLALIAIRPWHPRSLYTWPIVWLAGSFVRLAATLGGGFLLYSATQFGGRSLWLAVAIVYLAAMVGEARVYARSMSRIAPGGAEASTPE